MHVGVLLSCTLLLAAAVLLAQEVYDPVIANRVVPDDTGNPGIAPPLPSGYSTGRGRAGSSTPAGAGSLPASSTRTGCQRECATCR